jgi:hypothetical protein
MINHYARETDEFQGVTVLADGVPVTTGVKFAVVPSGSRPTVWSPPVTSGATIGVRVFGFTVGPWDVYSQTTTGTEVAVDFQGSFIID